MMHQKRLDFRPVTPCFRERGISYSWGDSFCTVFHCERKLLQIRFLSAACDLLGTERDTDNTAPASLMSQRAKKSSRRQKSPSTSKAHCPTQKQ
ncbi:hypothetical protein NDU88_006136 [Pleurodeles waltl]|uniref:Uncharacterized protein n=1 Tax=Pleurodeles waltl TaxID=8319 RepID=A0AAV7VNS1_PLEWA|nr:hypothetical protein NDU88_006136 [Pleurodeles waltl]